MSSKPPNALQAPGSTVPGTSDRDCLESWARDRDADSLQTLLERYLVLVHCSALRRTGDATQAAGVTRAVFLVLARRARRLRNTTVLAGWLFHVTGVACRKLKQQRMGRLGRLWQWISRKPHLALPSEGDPVDAPRVPNRSRAGTIAWTISNRRWALNRYILRPEKVPTASTGRPMR